MRVVVNLVGERDHGLLAESRFVSRPFLPGGEHNMYELAFAASSLGYEVELRGWLDRDAFERLADPAQGIPSVELEARRPDHQDLVVVPEGWEDPLAYARLWLSPAQLALFMLAPPGLFGWPFADAGWERPDPLTVVLDSLATAAQFQAIHRLGLVMLTNSAGIADTSKQAGVPCTYVGTGRRRLPEFSPTPKTVDVAALRANRWRGLVELVAADLEGLTLDLIDEAPNDQVLRRLAKARVLLWPSRIEGHATIPWEARLAGCVPVALSTNRFAASLSEETGALLVDRVEDLAPAVRRLLEDQHRLEALAERARRTAPHDVDWGRYVERVGRFFENLPPRGPEHDARGGMGAALAQWAQQRSSEMQHRLEELQGELQRLRADRDRLAAERQHPDRQG